MSKQYKYFHIDELWCIADLNRNVIVDHAFTAKKKVLVCLFDSVWGTRLKALEVLVQAGLQVG